MAAPPKTETPPAPGATSSTPPPPPIEYAYMYEKDKSPSKLLDALLRSISRHIVCAHIFSLGLEGRRPL
ncbi:uncharacterized protein B0J16DRAFT_326180 [Fusarium flagelliforme]|uniref:uncharacterized protein n=1 Tax=Fusarium flagelliforme TaxID=2675880 RepID=UPI001E8DA43C|nr:uncharacterized protein B0J16DRAFT_326180 [Fusarium flagelliforme]KAH7196575.1 hypothetical protein B0J16DRAFT_326180 [Fusarium flagelliforme]